MGDSRSTSSSTLILAKSLLVQPVPTRCVILAATAPPRSGCSARANALQGASALQVWQRCGRSRGSVPRGTEARLVWRVRLRALVRELMLGADAGAVWGRDRQRHRNGGYDGPHCAGEKERRQSVGAMR